MGHLSAYSQPVASPVMVLLAESHLAIHTWPETGNVTIDVYVCNFSSDNSGKGARADGGVIAAYAPRGAMYQELQRGDIGLAPASPMLEWVEEQLTPDARFGFAVTARQQQRTRYQHMELLDTLRFGRVLRLDGCFMTSEREEFFYHEALVHPAAIAHAAPRNALILGGGDGGRQKSCSNTPAWSALCWPSWMRDVVQTAHPPGQHPPRRARRCARAIATGRCIRLCRCLQRALRPRADGLTDPTPRQRAVQRGCAGPHQRVLAPGGRPGAAPGQPVFHPNKCAALAASLRPLPRCIATASTFRCAALTGELCRGVRQPRPHHAQSGSMWPKGLGERARGRPAVLQPCHPRRAVCPAHFTSNWVQPPARLRPHHLRHPSPTPPRTMNAPASPFALHIYMGGAVRTNCWGARE